LVCCHEKELDAKVEKSAEELEAVWKKAVVDSWPTIAPSIAEHVAKYFSETSRYVSVVQDGRGGFKILFDEPWPSGRLLARPRSAKEHESEAH
jgi:hypothetical protein